MSSPKNHIHKLLEVLKVVHRMERGSGFSQYLGLTQKYFDRQATKGQLHFDSTTNTLTSRLPIQRHQQQLMTHQAGANSSSSSQFTASPLATTARPSFSGSLSSWNVPLSTYQAMMDDVTTWALILADPHRGRAGVSVNLQSAWCVPRVPILSSNSTPVKEEPPQHIDDEEVTLVAKVDKVGRNLGFVSAQVHTLQGDLVCIGSHIKYLPMGLVMDFMQSSRGWALAQLYANYGIPDPPSGSEPPLSLLESLEFVSEDRAIFTVTPAYASLGGPIHGGCQAMLMEVVATRFLEQQQHRVLNDMDATPTLQLHSMSLDYLSSPNRRQVEVVVDTSTLMSSSLSSSGLIPVNVSLQSGDGRQYSRGVLHFGFGSTEPFASSLQSVHSRL